MRSGGVGMFGGRKYSFPISLPLDRDRTARSLWVCQTLPALVLFRTAGCAMRTEHCTRHAKAASVGNEKREDRKSSYASDDRTARENMDKTKRG